MNAPVKANIKNIESFQEFLDTDYITETKNRQNLIQNNQQDSFDGLNSIKKNCNKLSKELNQLEQELAKSTVYLEFAQKIIFYAARRHRFLGCINCGVAALQ